MRRLRFYLFTFSLALGIILFSSFSHALNFRPAPFDLRDALLSSQEDFVVSNEMREVLLGDEDEMIFTDQEKVFALNSLKLEGSTVLSEEDILPLYEEMLEQVISTRELAKLAEKIDDLYREKGYVLCRTFVPFQDTSTGDVVLKVVEGSIDKVAFRWVNMQRHETIKTDIEALKGIRPLKLQQIEDVMEKIRRHAGISVSFSFRPSQENPKNAADLVVIIARQAVVVEAGVNDTMPPALGKWVATGSVTFNSPLGLGERVKVYGGVHPSHNFSALLFHGAEIAYPLTDFGTEAVVQTDWLRTRSNLGLQNTERARDRFRMYAMGIQQEIYRYSDFFWKGALMIDRKKYHGTNPSDGSVSMERNLAVRLSTDMQVSTETLGQSAFHLSYHQGANDHGSRVQNTLPQARRDYKKFVGSITQLYPVDDNLSFFGMVRGQYAMNTLLFMEQFSYGGAPFGFAYPVGFINGDSGYHGKFEVRYGFDVSDVLKHIEAYTYYEAAKIWKRQSLTPNLRQQHLGSVGLGMRGTFDYGVGMFVEYALPFRSRVQNVQLRKRLFFGLSYNSQYGS